VDKPDTGTRVFLSVPGNDAADDVGPDVVDACEVNFSHPIPVTTWCIQEPGDLEPTKQLGKIGADIFRGTKL
jgi:hypothetical protein